MKEVTLKHDEYPNVFTVTTLEAGESKGWAGDRYVSRGPSVVMVEESAGGWYWEEYDVDDATPLKRLINLIDKGWASE